MSITTLTHSGPITRAARILSAATLMTALMIAPVLAEGAEGNTATTMSPPAPNAASQAPQPENSLPENAETSTSNQTTLPSTTVMPPAAAQPDGTAPQHR